MKVIEAINHIDAVKPNAYSQDVKIKWLSTLDGIIKKEIIDTHEGGEGVSFTGYTATSLMTEMIVPAPYDDIYIKWLEAQIDYANGEYNRYNTTITVYNAALSDFERAYNRTHMPIGKKLKYF